MNHPSFVNSQGKKTCILKIPSVHTPNSLKNLLVKRTGVYCDNSECFFLKLNCHPSEVELCPDLQLYFLAISPSFPSLLPTPLLFRSVSCFIFWLLLRLENKEAESCAHKALACQNGGRLRWDGRGSGPPGL